MTRIKITDKKLYDLLKISWSSADDSGDPTTWRFAAIAKIAERSGLRFGFDGDLSKDEEEQLFRAVCDGWVYDPKRFVLPMEGTEVQTANGDEIQKFAWLNPKGKWVDMPLTSLVGAERDFTVTQSDIDAAPKWVQVLERVEVTDYEQ